MSITLVLFRVKTESGKQYVFPAQTIQHLFAQINRTGEKAGIITPLDHMEERVFLRLLGRDIGYYPSYN